MSRDGIPSHGDFGGPVGQIRAYAGELGCQHDLALALRKTGQYESRMRACFIADPARVMPALMDAWAKGFDNRAVCDTACFHLFDRTPHAFGKVRKWSTSKQGFVKRAAFALRELSRAGVAGQRSKDRGETRKSSRRALGYTCIGMQ